MMPPQDRPMTCAKSPTSPTADPSVFDAEIKLSKKSSAVVGEAIWCSSGIFISSVFILTKVYHIPFSRSEL